MIAKAALLKPSSRIEATCDADALKRAVDHATRAFALAPSSGDAWSTLAFALYLQAPIDASDAAARKATRLEPDNWLHWLRSSHRQGPAKAGHYDIDAVLTEQQQEQRHQGC